MSKDYNTLKDYNLSGGITQMSYEFLKYSLGYTGSKGDMLHDYLYDLGYTEGSVSDRMHDWALNLGYSTLTEACNNNESIYNVKEWLYRDVDDTSNGAGDTGALFNTSVFSSMYEDSTGTTQVDAFGDPVGLIEDQSRNSNHATQATSSLRPALQQVTNGAATVNVIQGDGTQYLTGSIPSADYQSGFCIYGGFQHNTGSVSGNESFLSAGNSADNDSRFQFLAAIGSGKFQLALRPDDGTPTAVVNSIDIDDEPHIFIGYYDAAGNFMLRLDGVEYSASFTPEAITFNQFGVLCLNIASVTNVANAKIGQRFGLIDRVPTDEEIALLEASLANEWGITLP